MAKYYSPDGNIEIWDTKPEEYLTEEEWEKAHPYIDSRTLEEMKEDKHQELKSIRDFKETEPITTDKGIFDYDSKSQERLNAVIQTLTYTNALEESILWTTADNQQVQMLLQDFIDIVSAAANRFKALHTQYNQLKSLLNQAATIEEVQAIAWPEKE